MNPDYYTVFWSLGGTNQKTGLFPSAKTICSIEYLLIIVSAKGSDTQIDEIQKVTRKGE